MARWNEKQWRDAGFEKSILDPLIDPRGLQRVIVHCFLCKKSVEMNLSRNVQLEQSLTLERAGIFSELVKAEILSQSCRMYWVQLRNASVDHHRFHIDHPRTRWTR